MPRSSGSHQPLFASHATVLISATLDSGTVGIDVRDYTRLRGRVYHDRAGTFKIYFSSDGTTWEATPDVSTATVASTPLVIDQVVADNYVRYQWVNGAVGGTSVSHTVIHGVAV